MKRWRTFGTVIALAGLLFRLLIVAVHVPPAAQGVAPGATSLFSQIVLCTAAGLRVVQLDENGQPTTPKQSPGSASSCPICSALTSAPLASAPTPIVLPQPAYARIAFVSERAPLVRERKPLIARGRDPPSQA